MAVTSRRPRPPRFPINFGGDRPAPLAPPRYPTTWTADLFEVSVGPVVKSSRRVGKVLVSLEPVHIRWPNVQRREHLSDHAASKFRFQGCIGATDGTTFPLA